MVQNQPWELVLTEAELQARNVTRGMILRVNHVRRVIKAPGWYGSWLALLFGALVVVVVVAGVRGRRGARGLRRG